MFNWGALPEILIGFGVLIGLAILVVGGGNRLHDSGQRRYEEQQKR